MTGRHRTRRGLLWAVGVAGVASLAGCSDLVGGGPGADSDPGAPGGSGDDATGGDGGTDDGGTDGDGVADGDDEGTTTPAGGSGGSLAVVAESPVPGTDSTYAVMGRPDASKTATLFCGWKCPYTRLFVTDMLPGIVEQYVEPGDLAIEFRAVNFQSDEPHGDDEPQANRAGLAVWNTDPERFWPYVATLFPNQPSQRDEWATPDRLAAFAEQAGVDDPDAVRQAAGGDQYQADWQASQELVDEKGITGIPRFELGGEITAPTIDPESTRQQLESVLD